MIETHKPILHIFLVSTSLKSVSILHLNLNNKTLLPEANKHLKLYKSLNRFTAAIKYMHMEFPWIVCFHLWKPNYSPGNGGKTLSPITYELNSFWWLKFVSSQFAATTAQLHALDSGAKVFKHMNHSCRKCSIINFKCIWWAFPTSIYRFLC